MSLPRRKFAAPFILPVLPKKTVLATELLALIVGSVSAMNVAAQTLPTPGTVLETVRPPEPAIPAPRQESPLTLTPSRDGQNLDPNGPRTFVSEFRIVGNSAVDTATLAGLVRTEAGKPLNLYELDKVARIITDYYQSKGYPVARAVIPAQKVEAGVVTLEVIEGKVDRVTFRRNESYSSEFLGRWGQPLVGQTVRLTPLEDRMMAINSLPGMEARAVLTPGQEYGSTTVDVVTTEDPVDGQISVNNYGRREVGEHRIDASVNLNNPFGIGDQLGFRGSYSQAGLMKMAGINYSLPLDIDGTRLSASYTAVDYSIGGTMAALDLNGKSTLGGVSVIHPFIRHQNENLFGILTARYFSGKQYTSDIPISRNSISVLEAGVVWNRVDANANIAGAGLRVSSNFRKNYDDPLTDAQRFKIDADATYLLRMTRAVDLKLATAAQWSPDPLADSEKFSLGGPTSVRAYSAADVRGDRGAFASVEMRYRSTIGGMPLFYSVFADGGYTSRVRPGPGVSHSDTISSAGFGVTMFPATSVVAELMAAAPLSQSDPSDPRKKNGRIWFNLTKNF